MDQSARFDWKRLGIALATCAAGFLIALVSAFVIFKVGAFLLDCRPGQQDGQCGLGSFMALILATVCGIVLWPVSTMLLFRKVVAKRESATPSVQ